MRAELERPASVHWVAHELTVADLTSPLAEVARSLAQWQRGDLDEAIAQTLDLSARNAHARAYVAWLWQVRTPDDVPVWLVQVTVTDAAKFAPRGPIVVLERCLRAAVAAGADPGHITLFDWEGFVALSLPGLDHELSEIALTEMHPAPATCDLGRAAVIADGPPLDLAALRNPTGDGLLALAKATRTHPLQFIPTLLEQGWTLEEPTFPDEVGDLLVHRGFSGPEIQESAPSLAIEDDPCPRRRYARRVLRRFLHKRKIGDQYHTAFDHLAHGVAPEDRADAYAIGEALLRAGLLGEKPSTGQRHVFLRREALPRIHSLIERAESDPTLDGEWTCPPPRR